MKRIRNIIGVTVFALLILTMSVLCVTNPAEAFSVSERRPLATFPDISAESILSSSFSEEFETYSSERFPFRDGFRGVKAWFSKNFLRKLDNNGIFVTDGHISKIDGKENEDMLDYSAERFSFIIDKYTKDKNVNAYFSIVPDKNYFLAEKNGYPSLDYQALFEKVKEKTPFLEFIDITEFLSIDDYYTTDTHWRQENIIDIAEFLGEKMGVETETEFEENVLDNPFYGVYIGQLAIPFKPDTIKYLTNDTINSFKVTYYDFGSPTQKDLYDMKKAYDKDPYEMFLSGSSPLVTIENKNADNEKHLILFRDSFGGSIAPILATGYAKTTVVDIRYVQSAFLGNFIEFDNSDILFLYSSTLLNDSLAMK